MNRPEITSVTSEALQAQIRALLPSQQGFGNDLMAQNVIVPVIDLTATAEGSTTSIELQQALAFGSQTAFAVSNNTVVLANTAGFWRIIGNATLLGDAAANRNLDITMSDGLSAKTVYGIDLPAPSGGVAISENIDLIVFLDSGESISATSGSIYSNFNGSARQVADINGTLVNPSGFSPQ